MIDKGQRGPALTFLGRICLGAQTDRADVIRPINGPDFIRPQDRNTVLLEYGQHHPERERSEKVELMGHRCTPHLHLHLTGRAHALFKVTTDAAFVLFFKKTVL